MRVCTLFPTDQFNDVVRQENGRDVPGNMIVPPYRAPVARRPLGNCGIAALGRLIKIGMQDEHAILTFTATATRDDFVVAPPSEAYIKMIVSGLEETYPCVRKSEILHISAALTEFVDTIP